MKKFFFIILFFLSTFQSRAQISNFDVAASLLDTISVEINSYLEKEANLNFIANFPGEYVFLKNRFIGNFLEHLSPIKDSLNSKFYDIEINLLNAAICYEIKKSFIFVPAKIKREVVVEVDVLIKGSKGNEVKYLRFQKVFTDIISETDLSLIENTNLAFTKGVFKKTGFFVNYAEAISASLVALATALMFFLIRG